MKKIPGYKEHLQYEKAADEVVKTAAEKAVNQLEEMFKKIWIEDDATINNGELWHEGNNDEDDIYNL